MKRTNWSSRLAMVGMALCMGAAGTADASEKMEKVYDVLSNDGEGYDLSDAILGPDSQYDFGGWISGGYTSDNTGLFNDYTSMQLNQAWLYIERALDTEDGFDWGFRFDTMVGTDAQDTQTFGGAPGNWDLDRNTTWDNYGLAIPQVYVELGYKDFSIKGGHFYTPVGYEVVGAPGNFFYSHAFTMYYSEPFTHSGVLATYDGFECVSLFAGWTAGWDTGFDMYNDGSNFLGGASVTPADWATITYTLTAGDMGAIGKGYSHSIVADLTLSEKWNWVVQSDHVDVSGQDPSDPGAYYDTIGVNQYLFYTLSDTVKLGGRAEWWQANNTDYYEVTAGVNWSVLPNLMLRPEFRYQTSPDVEDNGKTNTVGIPVDAAAFAFDAVITF